MKVSVLRAGKRAGAVCLVTAVAGILPLTTAQGQSSSIVAIEVPGALSVMVTDLGPGGHVVGYYTNTLLRQRAFLFHTNTAVDLGTLGGSLASANGVNALGHVVGHSTLPGDAVTRPFRYRGGALEDLGSLGGSFGRANSINSAGDVVGYAVVNDTGPVVHAFLRNAFGLVSLGTLGGTHAVALKITDGNTTGGESTTSGNLATHAMLLRRVSRFDLGTLGGTSSRFSDVNDAGWVTGNSHLPGDLQVHAFLHDGTRMRDLGTLGGSTSYAARMNQHGDVVGDSTLAGDAVWHGFFYSGGAMTDLGHLGGHESRARAINNLRQVVGMSRDAAGRARACLWENGRLLDLNLRIPPGTGWELSDALFINDASQVVGFGRLNGRPSWFFMNYVSTPNQPPVADAGQDLIVECTGAATQVQLNGQASSDPEGDRLVFKWILQGVVLGTEPVLDIALPVGRQVVTLVVADPDGATAEDTVEVQVTDTTSPSVVCPPALRLEADASCSAVLPDLRPALVISDACAAIDQLLSSQAPAPGTALGPGTHSVTFTVTDPAGNVGQCSMHVTVLDAAPPTLPCPPPFALAAGEDCAAVVPDLTGQLMVGDNCTPATALLRDQRPAPGSIVSLGDHEVVFTVLDAAGNRTTCTTSLKVIDLAPPAIQCPAPVVLAASSAGTATLPDLLASLEASDACTPADRLSKSQTPAAGTLLPPGEHEVRLDVTDAAGNASGCPVRVTVLARNPDQTPPVIRRVRANPKLLFPPNGKLVPVTLTVTAVDDTDPAPRCRVLSVTSNEEGHRKDKTPIDWVLTGDLTLKLRAEHLSALRPRVYTVRVACEDAAGNQSTRSTRVFVWKRKCEFTDEDDGTASRPE
ncbi:MAG TPA: HYR domain-containing protein [Methylomirabilota bacterium]|nr:HYR domain-containing protein [Methylomirabilota bacterium]